MFVFLKPPRQVTKCDSLSLLRGQPQLDKPAIPACQRPRAYGQPELNINKTLPPGVKMATLWYFMGFRMMFPGRLTQGEGKRTQGWSSAWRHTLVVMALGRPKHEDQLKSKIQNQPSPHSEFKGMLVNTVTCLRGLKKKKLSNLSN